MTLQFVHHLLVVMFSGLNKDALLISATVNNEKLSFRIRPISIQQSARSKVSAPIMVTEKLCVYSCTYSPIGQALSRKPFHKQ